MDNVYPVSVRKHNERDTEIILSNGFRILTNNDEQPVIQITLVTTEDVIKVIEDSKKLIEIETRKNGRNILE